MQGFHISSFQDFKAFTWFSLGFLLGVHFGFHLRVSLGFH